MQWAFKLLTSFCLVCILGVGGFIFGYNVANDQNRVEITSSMILDRISNQYFIVTKSVLVDEKTQIIVDKGGEWSNLLWGQTIDAEATINVNIGVDLSKLNSNDILIDQDNHTISILIPGATVLDSNIYGVLDVDSKDGILKNIFNDTTNEDYNKAITIMKKQATEEVLQNISVMNEAEQDSLKLLEMILDNMGYKLDLKVDRVLG